MIDSSEVSLGNADMRNSLGVKKKKNVLSDLAVTQTHQQNHLGKYSNIFLNNPNGMEFSKQ